MASSFPSQQGREAVVKWFEQKRPHTLTLPTFGGLASDVFAPVSTVLIYAIQGSCQPLWWTLLTS